MTNEELFIKEGAWYHCARLIYRNQDVGVKADDGTLVLLPLGDDIISKLQNITDVEVKPAKVPRTKVAQIAAPVQDIDDILG